MPFCKICYDAGNENFSSHNIKAFNLQKKCLEIICPYLKNITCSKCGKKQHTASYCKEKIINLPKNEKKTPIEIKNNIQVTNIYDILMNVDLSESLNEKQETISYTSDGEKLGKLSDIIWGKGIRNNENLTLKWEDLVY